MSVSVQNTSASLSGKTVAKLEDNQTFTGQKTFDLGASAPFVCVSGSAVVSNLDADKLDGQEGTAYHDAALLTGVVPQAALVGRLSIQDPCGRLSLTTGTPVTISDVTAAGTLYWALYKGNTAMIYSGTAWQVFTLAQLSIAVPAVATKVYDVFLDYNAGTPALSLTAWTDDTNRATALTTQDGVLVLSGTTTKRYVGTVRTVTASQLNDSFALRHVWNYYHRVPRAMRVIDATNSWPYSTAAFQIARAAATNQLDFVVGVAEVSAHVQVHGLASNDTSGARPAVSIGYDSTTAAVSGVLMSPSTASAITVIAPAVAAIEHFPAVGRHVYTWLEYDATGGGTTTWFGDGGAVFLQSGITGSIDG